ncbi:MAG: shufflon system plasmid conjugative transfer pilus tip adhesin PilV [Burkholderia sp.]
MAIVRQPRTTRRNQQGFTLLELSIVMVISVIATVLAMQGMVAWSDSIVNNAVAAHAKRVNAAVANYMKDNKFQYTSRPGQAVTTGLAEMVPGKYLSANFADKNAWGQSFIVVGCSDAAGGLDAYVIYQGGEIPTEGNVRRVVNQIGIAGGYAVDGSFNSRGAYGSWNRQITNCSGGAMPGPQLRRLVLQPFLEEKQKEASEGQYVNRTAVAGRPELNRMSTGLDMGGYQVRNASQVYTSGRVFAGEYVELQGFATAGLGCAPNGLLSRDADGRVMSCVAGTWRVAGT